MRSHMIEWYSDSIEFVVNDTLLFIDASVNRGSALPNVFGIDTIDIQIYEQLLNNVPMLKDILAEGIKIYGRK